MIRRRCVGFSNFVTLFAIVQLLLLTLATIRVQAAVIKRRETVPTTLTTTNEPDSGNSNGSGPALDTLPKANIPSVLITPQPQVVDGRVEDEGKLKKTANVLMEAEDQPSSRVSLSALNKNNLIHDSPDLEQIRYKDAFRDQKHVSEKGKTFSFTTEGILADIERNAFQSSNAKQSSKVTKLEMMPQTMLERPKDAEPARTENLTSGAHNSDNEFEVATLGVDLETLKLPKQSTEMPNFIHTIPKGQKTAENIAVKEAHPDFQFPTAENTNNLPMATIATYNVFDVVEPTTTTVATPTSNQLDPAYSSKNQENSEKVSNEIRISSPSGIHVGGGGGSSEKRGKFISDNATNAQQLNLPNAAEVWTLASMKTVPKLNTTKKMLERSKEEVDEDSGETEGSQEVGKLEAHTPNGVSSNSVKNLLDWKQIMTSGEFYSKKLNNFLEQTTSFTTALGSTKADVSSNEKKADEQNLLSNTINTVLHATTVGADESPITTPITTEIFEEVVENATIAQVMDHPENEKPVDATTVSAIKADIVPLQATTTLAAVAAMAASTAQSADTSVHTSMNRSAADSNTTGSTESTILSAEADKRDNSLLNVAETVDIKRENSESETALLTTTSTTLLFEQPNAAATAVKSTDAATHLESPTPTTITHTPSTVNETASTLPPPVIATTFKPDSAAVDAVMTLNTNYTHNVSAGENVAADVNSSAGADVQNVGGGGGVGGATKLVLSHSELPSTTVSTLTAGGVNVSGSDALESQTSVKYEKDEEEEDSAVDLTILTTTLTTILDTKDDQIVNRTTEIVGQIGSEVHFVNTSTTIRTPLNELANVKTADDFDDTASEATTTTKATTESASNELLLPTNKDEKSNSALATTATTTTVEFTAETTPKQVVEFSLSTTTIGSTTPPTTTQDFADTFAKEEGVTPVAEEEAAITTEIPLTKSSISVDVKVPESTKHETEGSIETNDIEPLRKTASATAVPVVTTNSANASRASLSESDLTEKQQQVNSFGEDNNEVSLLPKVTTTTMAALASNVTNTTMDSVTSTSTTIASSSFTTTTTTEPPLISLLDDSTPTTITTTSSSPASISTKIEEIYTVVSSTETRLSSGVNATTEATTLVEIPHNATTLTPIEIVSEPSLPITTTPISTVLHTSMGGVGAASGPPTSHMPPGMTNTADTPETDVNVIIAISVSVIGVIALILLVAFLYLMRKRQKQMSYGQRCRPVSLDAYSLDNVSVLGSVRRKSALRASKRSYGNIAFDDPSLRHHVLNGSELVRFLERRSSIFEEFRDIPQIHARADEVPAGCEDKNRYANVIPLPETRVILQQQHDDEKTEYINANYVRGPKDTPNYYIACQAPLEATVADFWRMIWEQQSRVIIQATDLIENGSEKCAEYLPPSATLDNHTSYGDFQVTLKHREVKDRYAISTLLLKNTVEDRSRELTHYWYKWPETGVPNEEPPIIAMLLEARSSLKSYAIEQANELKEKSSTMTLKTDDTGVVQVTPVESVANGDKLESSSVSGSNQEINGNISTEKLKVAARNQGPLTVHCSPGTGRTGTIIACDMAMRSLETPKRSVDIPQIVYYVRRGRASAVQTKEQYEFIYKVAYMYATKITNPTNDN